MKHTNKKGFTIVELVIVIAVIAILAAVLIPTFTNLVKKANVSSDTQLVKNLNTILVAEEAVSGAPANFSDVIRIIRANGYIVENLNPTTAGHFVVWESTTNQFLLVDGEYKVVYSAEKLENNSIQNTWFFAVKDPAIIETITAAGGSVIPAVDTAWVGGNGQTMEDLLNKGGVIALSENITLTTAPRHTTKDSNDAIRIEGANVNVIYSLAGQTLEVTKDFDADGYRLIHAGAGSNVVLKDGTIVASVEEDANDSYPLSLYGLVMIYSGAQTTVENMNIVYNGVAGVTEGGAVFTTSDTPDGTTLLTIKDTVVTAANAMGAEIAGGKAIFENVTFKSSGDGNWNNICVAATFGGTAIIKSGTYIAANDAGDYNGACVGVLTTGGTLKIEGGSFEGKLLIYAPTSEYAQGDSVIEITGGSFNGTAFADMTAADWEEVVDDREGEAVITGVGTGTVTIKIVK